MVARQKTSKVSERTPFRQCLRTLQLKENHSELRHQCPAGLPDPKNPINSRRSVEGSAKSANSKHAPVAQLDRASVFGTEGCRFEPYRVHLFSRFENSTKPRKRQDLEHITPSLLFFEKVNPSQIRHTRWNRGVSELLSATQWWKGVVSALIVHGLPEFWVFHHCVAESNSDTPRFQRV